MGDSFMLLIASHLLCLISSLPDPNSFNYEGQNNYKMRARGNHPSRRSMNVMFPEQYPQPLPVPKKSIIPTPYETIVQGSRQKNDTRVYINNFSYDPQPVGHQIIIRKLMDCTATYLSIETTGGIPIILRGGVGYSYFIAVAKAKAGDALTGSVRAYCLKKDLPKN